MRNLVAAHEGFMNGSRTILPRVGVGVGEGLGVIHASRLTRGCGWPVDNSRAAVVAAWMVAPLPIRGVSCQ